MPNTVFWNLIVYCFSTEKNKNIFHFQNLPIERFWVEVNVSVNYPIKRILVEMDDNQIIDINDDIHKFCASFVSIQVASLGLETVAASWNEHINQVINIFYLY